MHEELLLDVVTLTELCRVYLPGMRERGAGRILNVTSTAALLPGPFAAVYYAAKAYVLSFSQAIAEELRASGVTVTCLLPGATATGFAQRAKMQQTLLFKLGPWRMPTLLRAPATAPRRPARISKFLDSPINCWLSWCALPRVGCWCGSRAS